MRALVVYESMFGNTKAVAHAVAEAMGATVPVDVREVGDAADLDQVDVDLLVVGAPTHAFSMSRPGTRRDAATKTSRAVISRSRGVREWIDATSAAHVPYTTFETHVRKPNLPGSAASAAAKKLRKLGCTEVDKPHTFYVEGMDGPLTDGELARASAWGTELAQRVLERAGGAAH